METTLAVLRWLVSPMTLKPVYRVQGRQLHVRSSIFQQLIGLFSYHKNMLVDPVSEVVVVQRRILWLWCQQWTIPFQRIKRIDYGFSDTGGESFRVAIEFYTISLVLIEPEETIKLFSFVGEYSEPASSTDVLVYGSDATNWGSEGGQAATSRNFVLLLKQFTGASLV